MNIAAVLQTQAARRPDVPAIVDRHRGKSRTTTFAELERASARAAGLLCQAGLTPGSRVLVLHPMSAELYIAMTAILRLGLVAMFLDPSAGRRQMERCCDLYPPEALVAGSRAHLLLGLFSPRRWRRIPARFALGPPLPGTVPWKHGERLSPYTPIHPCTPDSPALLTFTSGSAGHPKAALRTHGFLLAQHRALEQTLGLTAGAVDLAALPIFVLANLASGMTSLIPDADLRFPGAIAPAPVITQIESCGPTRAVASPAFLERLADHCAARGLILPQFQRIFTGGAPIFPRTLEKLQAMAPKAVITAVYGSTEAEPIAHVEYQAMTPADTTAMLGGRGLLTGTPEASIELRILPVRWGRPIGPYTPGAFAADCLPPGEAGEIVVHGDHVLPGYLHGRGDSETKFRVDGMPWHRTGDAGYLDAEGRLWLLGRCDARIEDSRGVLYPFAAECAAHYHPSVRRAAVVSCGQRRILAIELRPAAARADLASLQESLSWAYIDAIQVCRHIPVDKRHNAKIDYAAVRRLAAQGENTVGVNSPTALGLLVQQ